jgi:hypothetical protein
MTENYVEILEKNFWQVSTRWTGFWPKITVLTQNGLKLIFYPGRHGRTRIDSMDSVLIENDGFDPKRLKTHFLPRSTWFDPYWLGGLGFDRKIIFYSGRHGLTRIDSVDSVLMERCGWLEKNIYFFLILNFFLIILDFYK